jgi:hypothetical protein
MTTCPQRKPLACRIQGIQGIQGILWQQSDNVPFEQSRNVLLTAPSFGDAGRTITDDPSR